MEGTTALLSFTYHCAILGVVLYAKYAESPTKYSSLLGESTIFRHYHFIGGVVDHTQSASLCSTKGFK